MVEQPSIIQRRHDERHRHTLEQAGIHPLLARLWAARGVNTPEQTETAWKHMLAPQQLNGVQDAAAVLADAIADGKRLLVIADYDCDGATACAVGVRVLRAMGAEVDFIVPDRFETGYGLSPELVDVILARPGPKPDLLITVDNGIASVEGVAAARQHGMEVIITDHHLPGDELPQARVIVNPNQPGCGFPSKNLAGVGVMFYLMLALRAEHRKRGLYDPNGGPRLDQLADLVALGTVADVVGLDSNNRLLVTQGLARIRAGQMQPGIRALFAVAGRNPVQASTFDLGFALGPRINAAGRLADMRVGIACLISDDTGQALELARELDQINQQRRQIETTMRDEAIESLETARQRIGATVTLFHPDWHQGVVGLVASR
ncbi:MAG TPA: DHH family phosphoesterase, partial [Burkholderiaceae bacterium]|nr:DHH family phosphoesterase [Burkholderiaceae bacterium]